MKRAEFLLSILASLLAAVIYDCLKKIHWCCLREQFFDKAKRVVCHAALLSVISIYSFKNRSYTLKPTLASLMTAFILLSVVWFQAIDSAETGNVSVATFLPTEQLVSKLPSQDVPLTVTVTTSNSPPVRMGRITKRTKTYQRINGKTYVMECIESEPAR